MVIKFRGKRIDNGKWTYGDLVHGQFDGCSQMIEVGIQKYGCYPHAVNTETVGQYTGIDDKNNNNIYSNSRVIVSEDRMIADVVFKNGCYYTETEQGDYRLGGWMKEFVEVIED